MLQALGANDLTVTGNNIKGLRWKKIWNKKKMTDF